MPANVPASDTGTATLGIKAERRRRKNKPTTTITKPTEMARDFWISPKEARIVKVRSDTTFMSTAAGMPACSRGITARTRATVSITLASGCLLSKIKMAGSPLDTP